MGFLFFFSSRRRHTRWPRDWSSDVCSSDLEGVDHGGDVRGAQLLRSIQAREGILGGADGEIGRASCRERERRLVAAVAAIRRKRTTERAPYLNRAGTREHSHEMITPETQHK